MGMNGDGRTLVDGKGQTYETKQTNVHGHWMETDECWMKSWRMATNDNIDETMTNDDYNERRGQRTAIVTDNDIVGRWL
jgi:hypothetical protein